MATKGTGATSVKGFAGSLGFEATADGSVDQAGSREVRTPSPGCLPVLGKDGAASG